MPKGKGRRRRPVADYRRHFITLPNFLRPERFGSKLEEARARSLGPVLVLTFVLAVVALTSLLAMSRAESLWLVLPIYCLLLGMTLISGILLRSGRVRAAGIVYSLGGWLVTIATMVTYGTLISHVMVISVTVVIITGFVWSERAAVAMAVTYALIGLAVGWLQEAGLITFATRPILWWRVWLGFTGSLGAASILLIIGLRRIRSALEEVSESEALARASRERLRHLADRLEAVREEERKSISRLVHDELGQTLTALRLDLSRTQASGEDAARGDVATMIGHIDHMIGVVRNLSARLRPHVLDTLGLTAALEWEAERFIERSGVSCSVDSDLDERKLSLDPDLATAVFRIVQEALTNIVRHSEASQVTIRLRRSRTTLELEVLDDGLGIPEASIWNAGSSGLIGIRERAGTFDGTVEIGRRPEGGTRLAARFPLREFS